MPAQGPVSVGGGSPGVSSGVIPKGHFGVSFGGYPKGQFFNILVNFVKPNIAILM